MTVAGVPLSGLLAGIANVTHDAVFADLTQDSRAVRPGSLFLACQGGRSHGLQYLQVALERGAAGVIWEPAPGIKPPALPLSVVGMAVPQLSAVAGQIRCCDISFATWSLLFLAKAQSSQSLPQKLSS